MYNQSRNEVKNMDIPRIWNYMGNEQHNAIAVGITGIILYFSYKTVIAFVTPTGGLVVCQNDWGCTTGKHLNKIDGGNHKDRLLRSEFVEQLYTQLGKV